MWPFRGLGIDSTPLRWEVVGGEDHRPTRNPFALPLGETALEEMMEFSVRQRTLDRLEWDRAFQQRQLQYQEEEEQAERRSRDSIREEAEARGRRERRDRESAEYSLAHSAEKGWRHPLFGPPVYHPELDLRLRRSQRSPEITSPPEGVRATPRDLGNVPATRSGTARTKAIPQTPQTRTPLPARRVTILPSRPAYRVSTRNTLPITAVRRPELTPTSRRPAPPLSWAVAARAVSTATTHTATTLGPHTLANDSETEPTQVTGESTKQGPTVEEDENTSISECSICVEDKPKRNFPQITESCTHERQACKECVQHWIREAVGTSNTNQFSCLLEGCGKVLQHGDFRRLASLEVFEEYDRLAVREVLSTNPNWRWCLQPHCKSGGEHDVDPERPIFTCIDCGHRACAIHNVAWHERETCAEFELRTNPGAQDAASVDEIARITKPCPGPPGKACGAPIIKRAGCPRMSCVRCRHQFCWFCMADWIEGGTRHRLGCGREAQWRHI